MILNDWRSQKAVIKGVFREGGFGGATFYAGEINQMQSLLVDFAVV